ncbi:MAG: hypothetical protein PGN25_10070 [Methylorubrum populi]
MAHIFMFPNSSHGSSWPSPADTLSSVRGGLGGLAATLAALDVLLDSLRLAWWDGSSLALSRGGLESLVGLEPGDATLPRSAAVEARARGGAGGRA